MLFRSKEGRVKPDIRVAQLEETIPVNRLLELENLHLQTDGGRDMPPYELSLRLLRLVQRDVLFVLADYKHGKGAARFVRYT